MDSQEELEMAKALSKLLDDPEYVKYKAELLRKIFFFGTTDAPKVPERINVLPVEELERQHKYLERHPEEQSLGCLKSQLRVISPHTSEQRLDAILEECGFNCPSDADQCLCRNTNFK